MTDARAPRSVGCDMAGILDKRWVVMCVRLSFYSLVEGCAVCPRSRPVSNGTFSLAQCLNVLRPSLHHFLALGQILSALIRSAHLVSFGVRELPLNHIRAKLSHFIQHGTCDRPETMPCHLALETQTVEREQQRVIAYRLIPIAPGKNKAAPATDFLEFGKNGDRRRSQRHQVFGLHLHTLGRHDPYTGVHVELVPHCSNELIRPRERQHQQFERKARLFVADLLVTGNGT